jgi:hypothetical protein
MIQVVAFGLGGLPNRFGNRLTCFIVAFAQQQTWPVGSSRLGQWEGVAMPQSNSLKKDLGIVRDPGFLVTLMIIGLLCALGAYILIKANNEYGISIRQYWHW